jgi:hypothetical protein
LCVRFKGNFLDPEFLTKVSDPDLSHKEDSSSSGSLTLVITGPFHDRVPISCAGTSGDVKPVETGLDQLSVLRQLEAGVTSTQPVLGGQLIGLGEGRWYLRLSQPLRVNALFTGS